MEKGLIGVEGEKMWKWLGKLLSMGEVLKEYEREVVCVFIVGGE